MRKWTGLTLAMACAAAMPAIAVAAVSMAQLRASVADAARPAEDSARDADRKPAELMAFAGVQRGTKVVELSPGRGYFTRLLSLSVGANGKVYAFSTRPAEAIAAWAMTHPNTTLTIGTPDGPLASEPVDLVWTSLNYHDFKNNVVDGRDAAARYNAAAYAALKPGGSYLVVDHEAGAGAPANVTSTLHRIDSAAVIRDVEAAGFKLAARSQLLRHAEDNHTVRINESAIRGKTDQFVLRFVKPKSR